MVTLKPVPLPSSERWWTKLAKMPARIWGMTLQGATFITDLDRQKPSKWRLTLLRIGMTVCVIPILPVALLLRRRLRRTSAFDALEARVRELDRTSSNEALTLLRSTFHELHARGAYDKMFATVEIAPFGAFTTLEAMSVRSYLYDVELAFANFEAALAVTSTFPAKAETTILQKVDCLTAMGRTDEAIALLQNNLDLDGWRGNLRRRLIKLGGRHLRALN